MKEALEKQTCKWLLFIDTIDDPEVAGNLDGTTAESDWKIDYHLPSAPRGCILLTTRNVQIAHHLCPRPGKVNSVYEMTPDEARQMMIKTIGDQGIIEDATSGANFPESSTSLPLVIKHAAFYMNQNIMNIGRYMELFDTVHEKEIIRLLSKEFSDDSRYENVRTPIATTWLICFDQISKAAPLAAEELKIMAFLTERDIPRGFRFSSDDDNEGEVEIEALGTPKGYAFISEQEDGCDSHRLVRLCTLNWITEQGDREHYAIKLVNRFCQAFAETPDYTNKAM